MYEVTCSSYDHSGRAIVVDNVELHVNLFLMLLGLLLAFPVSIVAKVDKTHGVSPSLLAHYTPTNEGSTSVWTCLDGSKTISWSSVNDDYCDCPDGSDEPG